MNNEHSSSNISLLNDIEEENPTESFKKLSNIITRIIKGTNPRYTIGLYGKWGSGKTTLMKLIEKDLNTSEDEKLKISTVWFNAWRYERENGKATVPLILTILEKLYEIISADNAHKDWFDEKKDRLKKFVKGWSATMSFPIGFANIDLSYDPQNLNDVDYTKIPKPNIQEGIELIKMFSCRLKSEHNRPKLVVFIDDLDRCSSLKTLEVLESIKILLDIDKIVYVLGLNLNVINKKIKDRNEKNEITDDNYIQKIIQIPIWIPTWDDVDFKQLFKNNIEQFIDQNHIDILKGKEELLFKAVEGNPRQLKRMINSFIIASEIFDDTTPEKLLIVDLLRSIWNDMYQKFSTTQPFRNRIKELLEINDNERRIKLNKLHQKRNVGDMLSTDDEVILDVTDDFWNFCINTKKELFDIEDWPKYRSATKSMKNEKMDSIDYKTRYYDGIDLYNNKKYEDAIKCCDEAIKLNPNFADIYIVKGNALSSLGKYDDAIKCYDQTIKLKPDDAMAYNNKGSTLNDLGKYDDAIKCYDQTIKLKPDDAMAYNNKGNALSDLGKYDDAIKCYDQTIKLKPDDAMAYNNKGSTLNDLGKYDDAIKCYDQAIKLKPDYVMAYNNKGSTLNDLGKYDDAIKCYDQAIKLKPDYATTYYNKGSALNGLEKYDDAIKCYDQAIKLKPDFVMAYNNKGNALNGLEKYDDAIKCYDQAIKLKPDYVMAYNNKGSTLNDLEKYDDAIKCYDQAIKLKPDDATTYYNKGSTLNGLEKYDDAIKCYDQAIKLKPDYAMAYNNKGSTLNGLEKYDDAIKCYDQAIKLKPDYAMAYYNKGNALNDLEKYDDAIKYYNDAIQLEPDNHTFRKNKAITLSKLNKI